MQQSGGRRIKRSLFIDAAGVRFQTPDEEQRLSQVSLLSDYLAGKRQELLAWNQALGPVAELSANPREYLRLPAGSVAGIRLEPVSATEWQ